MIQDVLRSHKFNFHSEIELQNGIALVLTKAGIPFQREYWLNKKDKIDFLCGDVGIEVKVDGTSTTLARQVMRYLRSPELSSIVVVTSKMRHILPESLDNKQIDMVYVGGL